MFQRPAHILLITVIVFAFTAVPESRAQQRWITDDSTWARHYSPETIYLQEKFLRGTHYIKNGERMPAGGSYQHLRQEMIEVPKAYQLADVAVRRSRAARVLNVVSGMISFATFFADDPALEWGLTGGSLALFAVGSTIQIGAQNRLRRAVWIYNEEVSIRSTDQPRVIENRMHATCSPD